MYEKNGEKYFVFDSHLHFWDASPANWKPGAEKYAEGWIKCFHAYQGLGPEDTHWSLEHFEKYSMDDFLDAAAGVLADELEVVEVAFPDRLPGGREARNEERGRGSRLDGRDVRVRELGDVPDDGVGGLVVKNPVPEARGLSFR